jgi:uncharacterized protein
MPKSKRGFASMSRAKQQAIASRGGKSAHAQGTAHEWTHEEAQRAGRKGGQHPKKRFLTSTTAKRLRSNIYSSMDQVYFTLHEAATELRVSYRTVRRWIRAGTLPVETIREGNRNRHRISKTTIATIETLSPLPKSHNSCSLLKKSLSY